MMPKERPMIKTLFSAVAVAAVLALVSFSGKTGAEEHADARALVQERCTSCHNLNRVRGKIGRQDSRAWDEYVARMQKRGARVTDPERGVIVEFLSSLESGRDL
jgi:cytochrome c2